MVVLLSESGVPRVGSGSCGSGSCCGAMHFFYPKPSTLKSYTLNPNTLKQSPRKGRSCLRPDDSCSRRSMQRVFSGWSSRHGPRATLSSVQLVAGRCVVSKSQGVPIFNRDVLCAFRLPVLNHAPVAARSLGGWDPCLRLQETSCSGIMPSTFCKTLKP